MHERVLEGKGGVVDGRTGFQCILGVLEDEHVDLVVALEELEIELDRLLTKEDLLELVVDGFRFLMSSKHMLYHVCTQRLTSLPSGRSFLTATRKS